MVRVPGQEQPHLLAILLGARHIGQRLQPLLNPPRSERLLPIRQRLPERSGIVGLVQRADRPDRRLGQPVAVGLRFEIPEQPLARLPARVPAQAADRRLQHRRILLLVENPGEHLSAFFPVESGDIAHHLAPHPRIRLVETVDQRLERCGRVDLAQRSGRLDPHPVETVLVQNRAQLLHRRPVVLLPERLHGQQPANHVSAVLQLRVEHLLRLVEPHLCQQPVFRVETDRARLLVQRKVELLQPFGDDYLPVDPAARRRKADLRRQVEEPHLLIDLVNLLHAHPGQPVHLVPAVLDLEFGQPAVVHPLVEKAVEGAPRKRFDHRVEIPGHRAPQRMPLHIGPNAFPVQRLAELGAQHVQHPPSLGIGPVVELLVGIGVIPEHDRPTVLAVAHPAAVPVHLVEQAVRAVEVPLVQILVVRGEPLVEPHMAPVLAGHVVAEPLVGQLVGDQPVGAVHVLGLRSVERPVGQHGQRGVFHPAPQKVVDHHLVVLVPGKRHADLALEEPHYVGRLPKGALGLFDLRGRGIEAQRNLPVAVLDLLQFARHQRHQVVHVRRVLQPAHGLETGLGIGRLTHLAAIGQHHHVRRYPADHLGREALVRIIERRIPVTRLVRFPLGPQVGVFRPVPHLRGAEVQPLAGLRRVRDGHPLLLPRRQGIDKGHHQFPGRRLIPGHRRAGLHRGDGQIHRVQAEFPQRRGDRREPQRRLAGHASRREIRGHVDRQMQHVDQPVRGVLPPLAGCFLSTGRRRAPAAQFLLPSGFHPAKIRRPEDGKRDENTAEPTHHSLPSSPSPAPSAGGVCSRKTPACV